MDYKERLGVEVRHILCRKRSREGNRNTKGSVRVQLEMTRPVHARDDGGKGGGFINYAGTKRRSYKSNHIAGLRNKEPKQKIGTCGGKQGSGRVLAIAQTAPSK